MNSYQHINNLIKTGQRQDAQQEWLNWLPNIITRQERREGAEIARRLSKPEVGLRLLHGVVYPSQRKVADHASPEELTEYAANLLRTGITTEARRLLNLALERTREKQQPLLILGLLEMQEWNYPAAISIYKSILKIHSEISYSTLLAKLNLAFSLIWNEQFKEAIHHLSELIQNTNAIETKLIHTNAHELLALAHTHLEQFTKSQSAINKARALYGPHDSSFDSCLIERTFYFLAKKQKHHYPIQNLIKTATEHHYFDLLRDLDLKSGESHRITQVYYGSPFQFLKSKIKPQKIFYYPHRYKKIIKIEHILNGRTLPHRLLQILFSDLYKPHTIHSLFSALYTNEIFFPLSSPGKVHQIILRARALLKSKDLQNILFITEHISRFKIEIVPDICILMTPPTVKIDSELEQVIKIIKTIDPKNEGFKAKTLALKTKKSMRGVQYLLNDGISDDLITKKGKARAVLFFLKSSNYV